MLTQTSYPPMVIYDGFCNLCTAIVRFLYALDRGRRVRFLPSQQLDSNVRRKYGLTEELLQAQMHLIRHDGLVVKGPFALAEACRLLTPFGGICKLLRSPQSQLFYSWLAGHRYRLFGYRECCYVVQANRNQPC
jgi:predicted DCC family thiol-disulfide oxidoreductase YuxK